MSNIQKPFLKWVGGKTQLLNSIIPLFPIEMNNYHELFLGGGSVLLATLSLQSQGKLKINGNVYAYDLNKSLINLFNHIKSNKNELFNTITSVIEKYEGINSFNCEKHERKPQTIEMAMKSKESYYYWCRKLYNEAPIGSILRSALFLFLNKTCFRGMYREGPNGFNVPFGNYKKTPCIISRETLDNVSELIQNTQFIHLNFQSSIKNVNDGDFTYIDPPYAPEQANSFVGYTACGFNNELHTLLFDEIKELDTRNAKFVMSNAKVPLVVSHFSGFNSIDIEARRAINSKNPQSTTTETLIYN
jgi:DNA adenine methylase